MFCPQLLAMFDTERSHRLLAEMKNLRCTLADVVGAMTSLDNGNLHQDRYVCLIVFVLKVVCRVG